MTNIGPYVEIYVRPLPDSLAWYVKLLLSIEGGGDLYGSLELKQGDVVNTLELKNKMHELGYAFVTSNSIDDGNGDVEVLTFVYTFPNE